MLQNAELLALMQMQPSLVNKLFSPPLPLSEEQMTLHKRLKGLQLKSHCHGWPQM